MAKIYTKHEWLKIQQMGEQGYQQIISQYKNVLILSPYQGCTLGCLYCFRVAKYRSHTIKMISSHDLVQSLFHHPFFIPNKTPISIGCNATDPFLAEVKQSTFRILQLLDSMGGKNMVSLITKVSLPDEDIGQLESFKNLDIDLCVSYSAMPKNIEPLGPDGRIQLLRRLSKSKLRTILFYRPLIIGWNTSDQQMRHVLSLAKEVGVSAIVAGGVRILEDEAQHIRDAGLAVPEFKQDGHKKYLPPDVIARIIEVYKDLQVNIPMVRRSSCGRSVSRNIPDYHAHWIEAEKNCWETCPLEQKLKCAHQTLPSSEEVYRLLVEIGRGDIPFTLDEKKRLVVLSKAVSEFESNFLINHLNVPVIQVSELSGMRLDDSSACGPNICTPRISVYPLSIDALSK
jgi:DNA repair photolyase